MKVAICTNFVSPYRAPLFDALASRLDADVSGFVNTEMEAERSWTPEDRSPHGFATQRSASLKRTRILTTSGDGAFAQKLERHYPVGLPLDLIRFRPDVIISGELGPRTALAHIAGMICRAPVIPWTYHSEAQATSLISTTPLRRHLLNAAPAVIGMGTQARRVLRSLGCPDTKVFDAYNAADWDTIESRLGSGEHAANVEQIRASAGGRRIALVVGRLVEMKGIDPLLKAWAATPSAEREGWELVFVGDGPLENLVKNAPIRGIRAVGHRPPSELADWFAAADLHVFASLGDPWGLVVNEAMQCGTPTLCSRLAGCADDLIVEGSNGFLFDPTGPAERVRDAIRTALRCENLAGIGGVARADVQRFTPDSMARGFAEAIESCVRVNPIQRKRTA